MNERSSYSTNNMGVFPFSYFPTFYRNQGLKLVIVTHSNLIIKIKLWNGIIKYNFYCIYLHNITVKCTYKEVKKYKKRRKMLTRIHFPLTGTNSKEKFVFETYVYVMHSFNNTILSETLTKTIRSYVCMYVHICVLFTKYRSLLHMFEYFLFQTKKKITKIKTKTSD